MERLYSKRKFIIFPSTLLVMVFDSFTALHGLGVLLGLFLTICYYWWYTERIRERRRIQTALKEFIPKYYHNAIHRLTLTRMQLEGFRKFEILNRPYFV